MKRRAKPSAFGPPAFVVAAGLALSFPVWFHGWPAAGDAIFHASWFTHFDAQLRAGELYPRWLAGMNAGLGSPALYYYPPIPYYFASLLRPFVPAGEHNLGALGAAAALAYAASGLAAYAWLRKISDARSAAFAAALYLLAPYHSAVDLYTREAYAELWAFVWMPLALKFALGLAHDSNRAPGDSTPDPDAGRGSETESGLRTERGSEIEREADAGRGSGSGPRVGFRPNFGLDFAGLAVAYALLAASHPPATLVFSPVPVAYAYLASRRLRATLRAAAAMLLGACLSAVYLFPALAMQDAASFADMLAFNYSERWLTFARADARDLYGLLLWGTLTALALVACAALARRRDDTPAEAESGAEAASSAEASGGDETSSSVETANGAGRARRAEMNFWIVAAALSALLMTPASGPLWRALPVLQRVQFPWRFGLLLTVAASAAVALGLRSLSEPRARANRRMLVFAGLICAAWLVFLAGAARRAYPGARARGLVAEHARAAFAHGRDAPEYRPRWTNFAAAEDIEQTLRRLCGETTREATPHGETPHGETPGEAATTREAAPREVTPREPSARGVAARGPTAGQVRACVQEGEGAVTVTRRSPRELELTVESPAGVGFHVTQFYFPGWTATLDGRPHPLHAAPAHGLLTLSVPPGPHRLRLALEPAAPERAGRLLSTAALAALLLCLALPPALRRRRRRTSHAASRKN